MPNCLSMDEAHGIAHSFPSLTFNWEVAKALGTIECLSIGTS
jgi:hypothetical protein